MFNHIFLKINIGYIIINNLLPIIHKFYYTIFVKVLVWEGKKKKVETTLSLCLN